jgi:hypothetical protein
MQSALGPPTTERLEKSSPSGRMVKLIERDRYEQQEHLHSLFIMLDIFLLSLLRFFSFVIEPSKIETALDFLSDAIHFMAE